MIKKGIVLAALVSSLPLCAGVKLATTLNVADKEIIKELSLDGQEPAKISHEGTEFTFNVVDTQEDAVVLNVVASNVEEDGTVVERGSRHITAQWEKATVVDGANVTLSVIPSKVA